MRLLMNLCEKDLKKYYTSYKNIFLELNTPNQIVFRKQKLSAFLPIFLIL